MSLASAVTSRAVSVPSRGLLDRSGGAALRCRALAATGLVAAAAVCAPAPTVTPASDTARGYNLAAVSQNLAATVLTLEPGVVGIQHLYHFTPKTLRGSFCAAPNSCQPVDYATLPGDSFNEKGADLLQKAVSALPAGGGPVILMGYSQGAQVVYSTLRRWQADPATAPDPSRVSWVSIGNPDNPVGGYRTKIGKSQPRPAETPYAGTEVIRQYDGWADWPDDPTNLLAVFNAIVGMSTVHTTYFSVDINDPANVRYTPTRSDGSPGNVTYVWVPSPVLPLVAGFGPLAPKLDALLRPAVEAGYHRPVAIPAPGATPAATVASSASTPSDVPAAAVGHRAAPAASLPADSTNPTRIGRSPNTEAHPRHKAASSNADARRGAAGRAANPPSRRRVRLSRKA